MIESLVSLRIGTEVFTHPKKLPALPQIGNTISLLVFSRGYRYFGEVTKVVFVMRNNAGQALTDMIEIHCDLITKEPLTDLDGDEGDS